MTIQPLTASSADAVAVLTSTLKPEWWDLRRPAPLSWKSRWNPFC